VRELAIDAEVEKVEKISDIMKFGVMMTPALAIDGEVKVVGKVPSVDEIKNLIEEAE
jgi:small redox-active disulfide protein 2